MKLRSAFALTTALSACLLISDAALAEIKVNKAKINEGKIVLQGVTEPNAVVTLDGGVAKTTADGAGLFNFGRLFYVPASCMVQLTSPGQTTVYTKVESCQTVSLEAVGAWKSTESYAPNDLVTYEGSTYRARIAVPGNVVPGPDTAKYWEVFSARGATGLQGMNGMRGPRGLQGPTGATGDQGIQGIQGIQGTPGAPGSPGPTGPSFVLGQAFATGTTGYYGLGTTGETGATAVGLVMPVGATFTTLRCYSDATDILVTLFKNGNPVANTTCSTGIGGVQFLSAANVSPGDKIAFRVEGPQSGSAIVSWALGGAPYSP